LLAASAATIAIYRWRHIKATAAEIRLEGLIGRKPKSFPLHRSGHGNRLKSL
jgi:hypothetical protein